MDKGYYTRLINWLVSVGYKLEYTSSNNSYYLNKDSTSIRISDHIHSKTSRFTFQIFLSSFGNSYGVFYQKQFIPINTLKELKNFILQYEMITALNNQELDHGIPDYEQLYKASEAKVIKLTQKVESQAVHIETITKHYMDKVTKLENKCKSLRDTDPSLAKLEKLNKKIACQKAELKRLNAKLSD